MAEIAESKGKVALVTGSAKGIGAACAKGLAEAGYQVALHYRGQKELAEALQKELGDSAKIFYADLGSEEACQNLVKEVKEHYGRIDVLVNNAGSSIDQVLPFAKADSFESMIASNLKSTFLMSKFTSKQMIRQKSGSIINMSSVVGHSGNFGQSIYAATKSAITGFTKSIAFDLAPYGIRCNCVAPGFIKTDMTDALTPEVRDAILAKVPLKRLGEGSEVAKAVIFLAGENASYVTGSTLHVNGGMDMR